ncbi:aminotransferase class I/II-fold pyridoxal phosphate-dependent enzyme [Parasporobacterium paucivorans]|uniref:Arginine/lysine/ornithine decarboxylase n=1 Tax=Parasporobacterium paucivorans DSM 15970 TaxID=1122934 RepID=A0A1M6L5J6_9FIRM|nr:aminotransferase class I/II-fold pyridoxal phosphate-dependent enzyme [Parasporobacterium paucivorans]SHJ66465.1 Arginine/lysine/ornithine decarboxylase [Parasporobacterium paucivorans DSM 15970]
MRNLYDELNDYASSEMYPFHMPGHKRNVQKMDFVNPYKIDITEIEGFDNLHNPEGILKESMEEAARFYKTDKTYFLVNGSTCGILASISAATVDNRKILVARNSHKSVYNALYLRDLEPVYVYPDSIDAAGIQAGIRSGQVLEALEEHPDIGTVVITSPTYEGVVSDIMAIAAAVHSHGAVLIVDEAHGAHFGMHEAFPVSSVALGADLVVQSLHKTLPSFTQTAVLHVCGSRVPHFLLERFLSIYQTSSPSYLLMAGIDRCIRMMSQEGKPLFDKYSDTLLKYRSKIKELKNIRLFDGEQSFAYDPSKILLSVRGTGMTGTELSDLLRDKYNIQMEMASTDYALALTSCLDKEEGFERLYEALVRIDAGLGENIREASSSGICTFEAEQIYSIKKALDGMTDTRKLDNAEGLISADYVYAYPPGIPILVPGERITPGVVELFRRYRASGIKLLGPEHGSTIEIKIAREKEKTNGE